MGCFGGVYHDGRVMTEGVVTESGVLAVEVVVDACEERPLVPWKSAHSTTHQKHEKQHHFKAQSSSIPAANSAFKTV